MGQSRDQKITGPIGKEFDFERENAFDPPLGAVLLELWCQPGRPATADDSRGGGILWSFNTHDLPLDGR